MEVAIPPLTVLHPNHRLFSAELCSNTCRGTAGRTIAYLGLLQYSDAEATLCQPHGDKRTGCTTTNDNDMLNGRGKCHNSLCSLLQVLSFLVRCDNPPSCGRLYCKEPVNAPVTAC